MKTIKSFFIPFILFLMMFSGIGCLLNSGGNYLPEIPEIYDYFPLQVGNRWTYTGLGDDEITISITRSIHIEEKEYFTLSYDKTVWYFMSRHGNNFRKNENGDVVVRFGKKDYMQYAFSDTTIGNNITNLPNEGAIIYDLHDTVVTPAGTFENCYRVNTYTADWRGTGKSFWFARDIGPVRIKQHATGIDLLLKFAVVNGKTITNE